MYTGKVQLDWWKSQVMTEPTSEVGGTKWGCKTRNTFWKKQLVLSWCINFKTFPTVENKCNFEKKIIWNNFSIIFFYLYCIISISSTAWRSTFHDCNVARRGKFQKRLSNSSSWFIFINTQGSTSYIKTELNNTLHGIAMSISTYT